MTNARFFRDLIKYVNCTFEIVGFVVDFAADVISRPDRCHPGPWFIGAGPKGGAALASRTKAPRFPADRLLARVVTVAEVAL